MGQGENKYRQAQQLLYLLKSLGCKVFLTDRGKRVLVAWPFVPSEELDYSVTIQKPWLCQVLCCEAKE